MTLYQKAWLFTGWMVILFCLMPVVPTVWFGYFAGVFLLQGGIALVAIACPICGLSLYRSSKGLFAINQPWPRRRCGDCGHDHHSA